MQSQNKDTKRDASSSRELSRRSFLRKAATAAAVSAGASYIICGEVEAAAPGPRAKFPSSKGYILVDPEKCQGCNSCMLACSLVHEGEESHSLSRIQITQNAFESYPNDIQISQCRQCVDPECVKVCPKRALTVNKAKGNVRMVDQSKCIGCGKCHKACPYTPSRSVIMPHKKFQGRKRSRKCDLCANAPYHWEKGGVDGKQACVEVCPVNAIKFTKDVPVQTGSKGYKVNLKPHYWSMFGFAND